MKNKFKILGIALTLFLMSFKPLKDKKVIVIDAGHGGKDFGFIVGSAYEKEIVGNISEKIKSFNRKEDTEIILIGNSDTIISIGARVEKINQLKPDLVISLHLSMSNNKAVNGVQAFISEQNQHYEESLAHAEKLMQVVAEKDSKTGEVKKTNLLLLKDSLSPAVSLELGFLSNEADKNYLMSDKGQVKIAKRILTYLNK